MKEGRRYAHSESDDDDHLVLPCLIRLADARRLRKVRRRAPAVRLPLGMLASPPCELGGVRAVVICDEGGVRFAAEDVVCSGDGVEARVAHGRGERLCCRRVGVECPGEFVVCHICELASGRWVWTDGRTSGFDVGLGGAWGEMEDLVWSRVAVGWERKRR